MKAILYLTFTLISLTSSVYSNDLGGDGSGGIASSNGRVDSFPNSRVVTKLFIRGGTDGGGLARPVDLIGKSGHSDGGVWEVTLTYKESHRQDNTYSELTREYKSAISEDLFIEIIDHVGGENDTGSNL